MFLITTKILHVHFAALSLATEENLEVQRQYWGQIQWKNDAFKAKTLQENVSPSFSTLNGPIIGREEIICKSWSSLSTMLYHYPHHNNPMSCTWLFWFYTWRNCGSERLGNFPKIIQLISRSNKQNLNHSGLLHMLFKKKVQKSPLSRFLKVLEKE